MSVINQANNLVAVPTGTSWEKLYDIDGGALTNLTRDNFHVLPLGNDKFSPCIAWYTGSGAITTSELANLPLGSVIFAIGLATPALYFKTAAKGTATFKYQAVNT